MHIVFDSNFLARAVRSGSLAAKTLALVVAGPHELLLSPFILSEVARMLRYPRMLAMHGLVDHAIDARVLHLQTAPMLVNPSAIVPIVKRDPDDDQVVAASVIGKADVICTRDTDYDNQVRAYCQQHGI